jgi:hypothetical protein
MHQKAFINSYLMSTTKHQVVFVSKLLDIQSLHSENGLSIEMPEAGVVVSVALASRERPDPAQKGLRPDKGPGGAGVRIQIRRKG